MKSCEELVDDKFLPSCDIVQGPRTGQGYLAVITYQIVTKHIRHLIVYIVPYFRFH